MALRAFVCSPQLRLRGQAGISLLESVVAIAVVSIVVAALAGGLLTTAKSSGASNRASRMNLALSSFGENIKQLVYQPCADDLWYQSAYDAKIGDVSTAALLTAAKERFATLSMENAKVTKVEYWSLGSFPATGVTTPGHYEPSCQQTSSGTDGGSQRITFSVTYRGATRTRQIVKRNPSSSVFDAGPTATSVPAGGAAAPVAAFTATPQTGAAPLLVSFDASATTDANGGALTYRWVFGDGASSTGVTTTHTFAAGTFQVTLVATDAEGHASSPAYRTVVATGAPAAPTGLAYTRTGLGPAYVDLKWDPVPGVQEYRVTLTAVGWNIGCGSVSGVFSGASVGRVITGGVCKPTSVVIVYDARVQARAGSVWGPESPPVRVP